ncbi:MAG TPA: methyltransferase domain-containing protein [Gallionellaceae bacterium]
MRISISGSRPGAFAAALAALAWCSAGYAAPDPSSAQALTERYKQAIASPVRTDADRAEDARRKPLEFLQFTAVAPGMRVLDVSAGDGYTTQLLALAMGSSGSVWAQSPKARPGLVERLKLRPQENIMVTEKPFEDPAPADAPPFDLITLVYNYHDIAYLPVDRARMNKRLFAALKKGGHLVLLDHAARANSGTRDSKTLHRIDEELVVLELERAGFKLEQTSALFRNPKDPRDQLIFDMTMPVDNFALRFVKP